MMIKRFLFAVIPILLIIVASESFAEKTHSAQPVTKTSDPKPSDSSCAGCAEVRALEKSFAQWKGGIEAEGTYDLIGKASKAISKMNVDPKNKKAKLTDDQVKAATALLKVALPFDNALMLIDDNFALFEANQKAFYVEFKKYPALEANDLNDALDAKLSEATEGQDPTATPKLETSKNKKK